VPAAGGSDAETRARGKVEDVIRRAKAGGDFAALAKEVSEDTASAAQGGDLGYVGKGEMVPEFERALFALGKGEITAAPIRTEFGFHAVKVIDVQEGGRAPLAEVTGRIKDKLLAERTDRAAQKRADEVKPALLAAKDFAAEARKLGLETREATVARGEPLEGFGRDQALEDLIFTIAPGGTSTPTRTPAGYVFVRVAEVQAAGVPPLDQVKAQVVEAKRREEAEKAAVTRATALADAAAKAGDLGGLARKDGFTTGTTEAFSLAEPLKGPGVLPGNVMLAALQTASGQVSRPITTPAGVYVVRTLERAAPDPRGADAEREEIRRQLLEQKRGLAFERWVASLRSTAKIEMSSSVEAGAPAGAGSR
jgi:peptidyl-prolyl cis-trans isomerase D